MQHGLCTIAELLVCFNRKLFASAGPSILCNIVEFLSVFFKLFLKSRNVENKQSSINAIFEWKT